MKVQENPCWILAVQVFDSRACVVLAAGYQILVSRFSVASKIDLREKEKALK